MADEIRQDLGFDASQALDELKKLDKGFSSFEAHARSLADTLNRFNSGGKVTSKELHQIGKSSADTTKHLDRLTVSAKLVSRILVTQLVVSALGRVKRAFGDVTESAADFQRQLALIRTIDDTGTSVGVLGAEVRKLSDDFNIPLLQAAEGAYQALSNQVGDFGESITFTSKAAEFAKSTNSSLADSVDLLSGALKSFNLGVGQTDRVASQFFVAIDKGRITATELANAFGQVGPIAESAGVSMEEVVAGLSAITVKGTNTSKAITQFRAIINSLNKPSAALQAQLEKLGFATGEAAVRTLGLGETLKALVGTTNGSNSALARLFPNIRAFNGVVSLTSDGLKEYESDLSAAKNAGADFAKQKFLTATATDAERVTKALNKLKNELTVGIGQGALSAADGLFELAGGAENIIAIARNVGPALAGVGASALLLRAKLAATRSEALLLGKALGAIALVPLAVGVGQSIGNTINNLRSINVDELTKQNARDLANFSKTQADKAAAAKKSTDAVVADIREKFRQANVIYLADLSNAKSANESLVQNTTDAIGKIVGARERLVDELARSAADSARIVDESRSRVSDLLTRGQDRSFERSIRGFSEVEQAARKLSEAQRIASQASRELAGAQDQEQAARAIERFNKATSLAESADDIAARTKNRGLEFRAASALESVSRKQIAAERTLQTISEQRARAAEAERVRQQGLTDQLKAQARILLDNTSQFDSSGNQLDPQELAERALKRQQALQNIGSLALNQSDLTAQGALGIADFISRSQSQLSNDPLRLQFTVQSGVDSIQQQLQESFANFRLGVNVKPLEAALGRPLASTDDISAGIDELQKKADTLREKITQAATDKTAITNLRGEIDSLFQQIAARGDLRERILGGEKSLKVFNQLVGLYKRLASEGKITEDQLNRILLASGRFQKDLSATRGVSGAITRNNLQSEVNALEQVFQRLKQLSTLQQVDPNLQTQLDKVNATLNATRSLPEQFSAAIDPTKRIADNMARAASAAERAARAANSIGQVNRATGLATGGQPRGTDTVNAMLSPGEFVVNAGSSRRFFSQLQAINAGIAPAFQSGGNVSNVGIAGDVTINANTTGGQVNARDIVGLLRREMRRGASKV